MPPPRCWPTVVKSFFWKALLSTPGLESSREGTGVDITNVVSDGLGLEASGAAEAASSVELVLSHVTTGRDIVRAPSREVTVFSLLVKDSPEASEVSSHVLVPEVGETEAAADAGRGVDCVLNPGDFSARSVPWDPVACSAVSVLVHAPGAWLAGPGVIGILGVSGRVAGLGDPVLA